MTLANQDKDKCGPGRPKGHPKTGGRRKGTPNRTRVQTLERIESECDPIDYLCRLARGLQFEAAAEAGGTVKVKMYPTLDQRTDAAKILARKVLPDQKSIEHAGPLGERLSVRINLGT